MKTSHRKFKTFYIELILHSSESEDESESENESEHENEDEDENDEIENKQHRNRLSIDTKTNDAKCKDVVNRLHFMRLKS